jgi:hypothetical protein
MSDIQAEIRTSADGLAHRGSGQNWLARLARAGMVAQRGGGFDRLRVFSLARAYYREV